jgi:hypothetical protein
MANLLVDCLIRHFNQTEITQSKLQFVCKKTCDHLMEMYKVPNVESINAFPDGLMTITPLTRLICSIHSKWRCDPSIGLQDVIATMVSKGAFYQLDPQDFLHRLVTGKVFRVTDLYQEYLQSPSVMQGQPSYSYIADGGIFGCFLTIDIDEEVTQGLESMTWLSFVNGYCVSENGPSTLLIQ